MTVKPKHIGIVLSSVPSYSETFFRNKIKGLIENGHKVTLFVDYKVPKAKDFPCKIVSGTVYSGSTLKLLYSLLLSLFKIFFKYPLTSYRLFQLEAKDGKPLVNCLKSVVLNQFLFSEDLDWLHFGFGMLANGRENVAMAIKAKMAVSFRGYDLYLSPLKHPGCYDLLFKKEVKFHVLSKGMKTTLLEYGIKDEMIHVITPAINVEFFSNNEPKSVVDHHSLKITTIARLHWKKGLNYTLDCLALLKEKKIPFNYTIIGEGEELERLAFAVHQLGLTGSVEFAGKLTPAEIKEVLKKTDIYLQYSVQEGFCNSVLEAQCMQVFCIVSNAEGLDENVVDGITGWVVPKRRPELLAKRIMEVVDMPVEEFQTIKYKASERVKKEFDLETQQKAFIRFYTY
ncbi:glycosyltransferase [Subsaxibacter sp. CAU 1640]|uniref:glycosyltransferase n=1 Tax=Subsaxibacter sp. CAU 1640 TaxID=2933271 RepID=UPI002003852D|nr:glycosyltransferase [Subsaxibacter sp. CAU 1640]MCK7589891.1 glycosyltransferase [Subsaxibacter sp. CAU 1640]